MNAYPSNTVDNLIDAAWAYSRDIETVHTLFSDLFLVCRFDTVETLYGAWGDPGTEVYSETSADLSDETYELYDPEGCVADNDPYGLYDDFTDEEREYFSIYSLSEVRELDTRPTNHYWKGICAACDKPEELCDCGDFDPIPF